MIITLLIQSNVLAIILDLNRACALLSPSDFSQMSVKLVILQGIAFDFFYYIMLNEYRLNVLRRVFVY